MTENVIFLDDLDGAPGQVAESRTPKTVLRNISASPFSLPDPRDIRQREWLYGRRLIRRFVSCTVAPGGVGKSSLLIAEALAMVSGKPILGASVPDPLRVWSINLEDPLDELQRRFVATAAHYGIGNHEIGGRLFLDSGRTMPLVLATMDRNGPRLAQDVVDQVKETILDRKIDVVIVDPFISSHRVPENDNNAVDFVTKAWARIADETGCAIELVHHVRKTGGAEATVENARGGSALIDAVRSARVLNTMSEDDAAKAGVDNRRLHFSAEDGKANLAPPSDKRAWFKLESVAVGNGYHDLDIGDLVGVVSPWKWPDPLDGMTVSDLDKVRAKVASGEWRENVQSAQWVGKAVAEALGLDLGNAADKAKIKSALRIWLGTGALIKVDRKDANHESRTFVEVGE